MSTVGHIVIPHVIWRNGPAPQQIQRHYQTIRNHYHAWRQGITSFWNNHPQRYTRTFYHPFHFIIQEDHLHTLNSSVPSGRSPCSTWPKKHRWRRTPPVHYRTTEPTRQAQLEQSIEWQQKSPGSTMVLQQQKQLRLSRRTNPCHQTVNVNDRIPWT